MYVVFTIFPKSIVYINYSSNFQFFMINSRSSYPSIKNVREYLEIISWWQTLKELDMKYYIKDSWVHFISRNLFINVIIYPVVVKITTTDVKIRMHSHHPLVPSCTLTGGQLVKKWNVNITIGVVLWRIKRYAYINTLQKCVK